MQEDYFSIHSLHRFDLQKKSYPIDPGIAQIWSSIGENITRVCDGNIPILALDECGFYTQMLRYEPEMKVGFLYSEKSQSEIDFYFKGCAFELKSKGKPTPNQMKILKEAPHFFVLTSQTIPLMAYLIGEGRAINNV